MESSPLDFCFRNIFNNTQRLTNILKADIQMAIQLGLNEIKEQVFSLIGEFLQKLLDEASALDSTQLLMFTHGLHDRDRGANVLHHCQARQQDKPAEDSFFRGGPTPSIHNALIKLPFHGKLVYQELQTDLERGIQNYLSAVYQKIKQNAQAHNFSDAIPTVHSAGQSAAGSASEVLKEEHPLAVSFGITDRTLEGDSGTVSGIPAPSHTSADCETENSDVMIVATTPAPECQALVEIPVSQLARDTKQMETTLQNVFKVTPSKQDQAVSTFQSIMSLKDEGKDPNAATEPATTTLATSSTATTTLRDILAMKLKLSVKELKHLQKMVATDVRMEHVLQTAAQEGINLPASPSLPLYQESFGEAAAVQPKFPIKGLVLLA